jgi:hypothetical protein
VTHPDAADLSSFLAGKRDPSPSVFKHDRISRPRTFDDNAIPLPGRTPRW